MSSSWQTSLANLLNSAERIAILGIGHEFRCDDAAGLLAARALLESGLERNENILVLEAGSAPENATAKLRRFAPHLILILDAAGLDSPPGSARLVEMSEIGGISAATHSLPISMLAGYLHMELNCHVALLGIQPESTAFGEGLSEPVQKTVKEVVHLVTSNFNIS